MNACFTFLFSEPCTDYNVVLIPFSVHIVTPEGETPFRGYIIQARREIGETTPVGTFSTPDVFTAQTLTCIATDDTATHPDRFRKNIVKLQWTAPAFVTSDLEFV